MHNSAQHAVQQAPMELCIALQPRFAMADLVRITEWLKATNEIARWEIWRWHFCSARGEVVIADNGIVLSALKDLHQLPQPDQLTILREQPGMSNSEPSLQALIKQCHTLQRPVFEIPASARSEAIEQDGQLTEMLTHMTLPYLSVAQSDVLISRMETGAQPVTVRDSRVHRALFLMQQNLEYPLDKHQLANGSFVSVRQLERLFKRYFDETPARYYTRLRLETARTMLQKTDLQIGEIAQQCGFNSVSHFCRIFQQSFGIRPGDTRPEKTG